MKRLLVFTALLWCYSLTLKAQRPTSDFIRVDQFGYRPQAQKVAVVANPKTGYDAAAGQSFAPSTGANQYQLRRTSDDGVVFSGTLAAWNGGATDESSGDQAWWFDFSSVTTPGSYYVFDVGRGVGSFAFDIRADVYAETLRAAVRMFYYNRCNFAKEARFAGTNWADGASFVGPRQDKNARSVFDQSNAATEKDLSGGWWDAGDNNKYVTFAQAPMHALLSAYTDAPSLWTDNYSLPESGNGIPDLLDEVKWELDWLKKMQLPNGASLIKVGTLRGDWNAPLLPSTDARYRYYYPDGCTSATIANAGMLAHAALALKNVPALAAYAADLQARAVAGYNNFNSQPALQDNCDNQSQPDPNVIFAGDADGGFEPDVQRQTRVLTAVYLYALTGDAQYRTAVDAGYDKVLRELVDVPWQLPYDAIARVEALLYYGTLPGATAAVASDIRARVAASTTDTNRAVYGFAKTSNRDPYRAFMDKDLYNWGSNSWRGNYSGLNAMLVRYNVDPANNADYELRAEEMVHALHGVNPFNLVYLSNMAGYGAEKSVDELFHFWFRDGSPWDNVKTSAKGGPAPGYVPGGPNPNYRDTNGGCPLSPPCGQPMQKSWRAWNTDGTDASYQVTEPAIYYQANYVRALARYAAPLSTPALVPGQAPPSATTGLAAGGVYELKPACAPTRALDVSGVSTANGANVHIWNDLNQANQRWQLEDAGGGYYRLVPQHASGQALDVAGAAAADGTNVQQWTANRSDAQKWKITDVGGGYYKLQPACAPAKCLNVNGGANTNGANVQLWADNGSNAQKWKLEAVAPASAVALAARGPAGSGDWQVYPNPASGQLFVTAPAGAAAGAAAAVRLTDLLGKTVLQQQGPVGQGTKVLVDVKALSPGVYLLEAVQGAQRHNTRVVVQ